MNTVESTIITGIILLILMTILAIFIQTAASGIIRIQERTYFLEEAYSIEEIHVVDAENVENVENAQEAEETQEANEAEEVVGAGEITKTNLGFVTNFKYQVSLRIQHPLQSLLSQKASKVNANYSSSIFKTRWWLITSDILGEVYGGVNGNLVQME